MHDDLLISCVIWYAEKVEDFFYQFWRIWCLDADSTTYDEVDIATFGWVISDIEIKVVRSLLSTGLCQLPGVMDFGGENFVRRMWRHELRRVLLNC